MNRKYRIVTTLGLSAIAFTVSADTLSLDGYVNLVLEHNPQPKIAASAVQSSSAAREKSRSSLLPHAGASAGVSRTGSGSSSAGAGVNRGGGNTSSAGIDAQLLLFDFWKTPYQYMASDKAWDAARYDMISTLQTTVLNARTAYFNYLLSEQLLKVNIEALKQAKAHYDQAQTLYDVGKQAKIAITKANVDVANAQVNVIHARNTLNLARVQLETTAGIPIKDPLVLSDSLGSKEDSIGMDGALVQALQKRPEILSAKTRLEAARLQLRSARAAYLPSVNASGGYDWQNSSATRVPAPDWSHPGWNIGASLSVPLYQGGAVHAGVLQADAAVQQAEASLDATTLNVTQEVQQDVLQERYRNGIATSLEITDAEVTLANARISHLQAQFDYRVAHAKLLLSIGALHD
jgi:outer membrane protein